ncbi:MAG: prenyltransferase/squalene oxidase repeat-containing protein [bacterium]
MPSKNKVPVRKSAAVFHALLVVFIAMLAISPGYGWSGEKSLKDKEKPEDSRSYLKQKKLDVSLRKEAQHSIDIALNWLKQKQNEDGSWSNPDYPAVTALVALGFLRDPSSPLKQTQYPPFLQKSLKFIVGKVQPDGGIYTPEKGLANYNTSICLTALAAGGDPAYHSIIKGARNFLVSLQKDEGVKGVSDNPTDGGIGYGTKDHSDMSNMYLALEALYVSRHTEIDTQEKSLDSGKVKEKDLNWQAALKFIERCQNNPSHNDQPWASDDKDNYGGFVYFPGNSKAGEVPLAGGKTALRSYGSMTYAGLLSFIYAQLERDDPRVQAAYQWITRHYSLDENPGLGQQGLYYNYHTMAKALAVYGEEKIPVEGREEKVAWRKELLEKLIELQKGEGCWLNENGRWWESDPVLVTAYAVLAMEIALSGY